MAQNGRPTARAGCGPRLHLPRLRAPEPWTAPGVPAARARYRRIPRPIIARAPRCPAACIPAGRQRQPYRCHTRQPWAAQGASATDRTRRQGRRPSRPCGESILNNLDASVRQCVTNRIAPVLASHAKQANPYVAESLEVPGDKCQRAGTVEARSARGRAGHRLVEARPRPVPARVDWGCAATKDNGLRAACQQPARARRNARLPIAGNRR